jgi:hypothetical protein
LCWHRTTHHNDAKNTGMLIKAIANNCPNIEYLDTHIVPEDFIYVKQLLLNCRNLECLIFHSLNNDYNDLNENNNIGDELLDILIKFSPESLIYVHISDEEWKCSTADAFKLFSKSLS